MHRIFWLNHPILVHHVTTHRQPPCSICGVSGHLARTCTAQPDDMKKRNCILFSQADIVETSTTMASSTSSAEMRTTFEKPAVGKQQQTEAEPAPPSPEQQQTASPPQQERPPPRNAKMELG